MNEDELIKETIKYFSNKNRKYLKRVLTSTNFDGNETRKLNKIFKEVTTHPFTIDDGIFDYVVENIKSKNFDEVNINDIGDLSWNIQILLNKEINKGYDWDSKLVIKCGGTARILEIYINFLIPAYTFNKYYMTYSKKDNYYEFGKIYPYSYEKKIIHKIRKTLKKHNYFYVNQKLASKKIPELVSDVNQNGNATIFDCLFSDVHFYQGKTKRFNDKEIIDPTGKKIHWEEYYDNKGQLLYREEFRYFKSKNVLSVVTDKNGRIIKVNAWRDIGKYKHKNFCLNIK